MIPAPFAYHRPQSLEEALALLREHGEAAKVLAGGHSLVPAMKLRLAQPGHLIDLGRIAGLDAIREQDGRIVLGALATHHAVESSALLREKCPLLGLVAAQVGDVQVRNRGTVGGSVVHADPAADWPAAMLALQAEIEVVGLEGARVIPADKFFVGLFETALQAGELLREIRLPLTGPSVAYVKTHQRASGFALAGAAVVIDAGARAVRVALNGVAGTAYRATAVEKRLAGQALSPAHIAAASAQAGSGIEALSDMHGSAAYRLHLACVNTRRALELAAAAV